MEEVQAALAELARAEAGLASGELEPGAEAALEALRMARQHLEGVGADLIGPIAAARLLGVSANTVRSWVANKRLRGFMGPNGRLKLSRADVLAHLSSTQPTAPPTAGTQTAGHGAPRATTGSSPSPLPADLDTLDATIDEFLRLSNVDPSRLWPVPRHLMPVDAWTTDDFEVVSPLLPGGPAIGPVQLTDLSEDAVIVVGEPGAGKSFDLLMAARKLRSDGNAVLFRQAGHYKSDADLWVLEKDLRALGQTAGVKYLFIDGLDESDNLRLGLVQMLHQQDRAWFGGMRLRLGTRPIANLDALKTGLTGLFAQTVLRKLSLLTEEEVTIIAAAEGIAAQAFLKATVEAGVAALTSTPLSLRLLISHYKRHGAITGTQEDLYREACEAFCQDWKKESLLPDSAAPRLDARQRLAIARRVAALSAFANCSFVSRSDAVVPEGRALRLVDLSRGDEPVDATFVTVDPPGLREVLTTALFTFPKPTAATWQHRSYRDFLAADWVLQNGLTAKQAVNLLDAGDGHISPQTYPIAGWLAQLLPGFLEEVLRKEPEILLESEVIDAVRGDAAAAVGALLTHEAAHRHLTMKQHPTSIYARLGHTGIADQLRKALSQTDEDIQVVACLIARGCQVQAIDADLASLALDTNTTRRARGAALAALRDVGRPDAKKRVLPLVEAGNHVDLIGLALQCVWPHHISLRDVLSMFPDPRRSLGGTLGLTALDYFFLRDFHPGLTVANLPVALAWSTSLPEHAAMSYTAVQVFDHILQAGAQDADTPAVGSAFRDLIEQRLSRHDPLTYHLREASARLLDQPDERRQWYVAAFGSTRPLLYTVRLLQAGFVVQDADVQWMIDQSPAASDDVVSSIGLMLRTWASQNADKGPKIASLYATVSALPHLWPYVEHAFDALPIASKPSDPAANREAERVQRLVTAKQSLAAALTSSDPVRAWHRIAEAVAYSVGDIVPGGPVVSSDLFQSLSFTDATQCEATAIEYLAHAEHNSGWFDKGKGGLTVPASALDGVAALRLLAERDQLAQLTPVIIRRWMATMLAQAILIDDQYRLVCEKLYRRFPKHFLDAFDRVLRAEIPRDHASVTYLAAPFWDAELGQRVAKHAADPRTPAALLPTLLRPSLAQGDQAVYDLAIRIFDEGRSRDQRTVAVGQALLSRHDATWSVLWPAIQRDAILGHRLLETDSLDVDDLDMVLPGRLTEPQLAGLYSWLLQEYPDRTRRSSTDRRLFEPQILRSTILSSLQARGTEDACQGLRTLIQRHPDQGFLNDVLREAELNLRRRTWEGVTPDHVLALTQSGQHRIVRTAHDLLDVVTASLHRIQRLLSGETPLVRLLWNEGRHKPGQPRVRFPKQEEDLSDFVKSHLMLDLRDRGIVVNREVQISRLSRVDLLIEAFVRTRTPGRFSSVSVVVEMKGAWNADLADAMQKQLADRYLATRDGADGLYVVGWFNCDAWNDKSDSRRSLPTAPNEQVRRDLDGLAGHLSTGGRRIQAFHLDCAWSSN